ncbi:MAG: ester cyclase [Candidatus Bathyarchaeota archaeon]
MSKTYLASLDKLMASDYVDDTLQINGLENYKQLYAVLRKGIPDFHETIEDIVAEGEYGMGSFQGYRDTQRRIIN